MLRIFRRSPESDAKTEHAVERTRKTWFSHLTSVFERSEIDDALWEELEELLIGADTGVSTTHKILGEVQERVNRERIRSAAQARELLRDTLVGLLNSAEDRGRLWSASAAADGNLPRPAVILVVGVNGTGKTTSIAKLAHAYRANGSSVIIAAADTFRAAAIEQMKAWGDRVGATVIAHKQGADPGAVVFDALSAAESRNADVVIIDTAGRLHTKFNLMEELGKIQRVIQRKFPDAPHETLLVLDATIGQNALAQAKAFAEVVNITGVCLTKLDGTAKGGIVFAVVDQLAIPVRFVGTGERAEDLSPFDAETFVRALMD